VKLNNWPSWALRIVRVFSAAGMWLFWRSAHLHAQAVTENSRRGL
jgi:hypothetical protein